MGWWGCLQRGLTYHKENEEWMQGFRFTRAFPATCLSKGFMVISLSYWEMATFPLELKAGVGEDSDRHATISTAPTREEEMMLCPQSSGLVTHEYPHDTCYLPHTNCQLKSRFIILNLPQWEILQTAHFTKCSAALWHSLSLSPHPLLTL